MLMSSRFFHPDSLQPTDAWETKSVSWTMSPVCASTNASYHMACESSRTCTTCVRATEPSCFATNSSFVGCWLYFAPSSLSALEIASAAEKEGVVEGTLAVARRRQQDATRKDLNNAQGFTNEDPKETTLLALLNATLATAFATGMPFCRQTGVRQRIMIMARISSTTHNLLVDVCVLDDVVRVPSPVRSPIGGHVELRLDEGHCGVLEAELCTGGERVVDPVHTEGLKSSTRQLHVGTQHR